MNSSHALIFLALSSFAAPAARAELVLEPKETKEPKATASSNVGKVCQSATTKKPTGPCTVEGEFEVEDDQVSAWFQTPGLKPKTQVRHVWSYEGKPLAGVRMRVMGKGGRTNSTKRVNEHLVGNWHVEILTEGTLQPLAGVDFSIAQNGKDLVVKPGHSQQEDAKPSEADAKQPETEVVAAKETPQPVASPSPTPIPTPAPTPAPSPAPVAAAPEAKPEPQPETANRKIEQGDEPASYRGDASTFRLQELALFESGGNAFTLLPSWHPSLVIGPRWELSLELGATWLRTPAEHFFMLDVAFLPRYAITPEWMIEAGPGFQAWFSPTSHTPFTFGANLGRELGSSWLHRLVFGYTAAFIPNYLTHEVRLGVELRLGAQK